MECHNHIQTKLNRGVIHVYDSPMRTLKVMKYTKNHLWVHDTWATRKVDNQSSVTFRWLLKWILDYLSNHYLKSFIQNVFIIPIMWTNDYDEYRACSVEKRFIGRNHSEDDKTWTLIYIYIISKLKTHPERRVPCQKKHRIIFPMPYLHSRYSSGISVW